MPVITQIDQIPTAHTLFPPHSHPDLQYPGTVHHGWNTGRQLLLHAAGSPLAKPMPPQDHPQRHQAIEQLRPLDSLRHGLTGPLTIALYITAVHQPPVDLNVTSLTPLIAEALADLGHWGIRAPLTDQLDQITQAIRILRPCMPD